MAVQSNDGEQGVKTTCHEMNGHDEGGLWRRDEFDIPNVLVRRLQEYKGV